MVISPKKEIANAVEVAKRAIANAAVEAAKVIANAAAEATKVANVSSSLDHDLLITLASKMDALKDDIKDLKDWTSIKIENHERRLWKLETSSTKTTVMLSIGIGLISILVGLVIYCMRM